MLLGKPVALLPNLFVPGGKLLTLLKMRMTDDDDDDRKQLANFKMRMMMMITNNW